MPLSFNIPMQWTVPIFKFLDVVDLYSSFCCCKCKSLLLCYLFLQHESRWIDWCLRRRTYIKLFPFTPTTTIIVHLRNLLLNQNRRDPTVRLVSNAPEKFIAYWSGKCEEKDKPCNWSCILKIYVQAHLLFRKALLNNLIYLKIKHMIA